MNRNTLVLTLLAFVIVALATPFQLFDVPLAPVAALVFGAIAGWWMLNNRGEHTATEGFKAGAIVGVGAMLGSVVGLALLALFVSNIPEVQAYIQNSEPHPQARIPSEWIAPLGALAGVIVGLIMGLFDLADSAVAGLVAGALSANSHAHQA
jgi:hypothetical protein